MDKTSENKSILSRLEFLVQNGKQILIDYPLKDLLEKQLRSIDDIQWLQSGGRNIEDDKADFKKAIHRILDQGEIFMGIKNLLDKVPNPFDESQIHHSQNIMSSLFDNMNNIIEDTDDKMNLIFIEHDIDPEAYATGYQDDNFQYKRLSGEEYLKFDFSKLCFEGDEPLDYNSYLDPFIKFEEELGEDLVDEINDLLHVAYLEEIKKLFLLNGFISMHQALNNLGSDLRQRTHGLADDVFFFVNEHDCEQLNLFVL